MKDSPIAIIDSGLGGLSIAQAIWSLLPKEHTIYLADHQFFPYGNKTKQQINRRVIKLVNWLIGRNVKIIVIACNTITVSTINFLRQIFPTPFVGTVPAIKPAIEKHKKETIVVLATPTTATSSYLADMLNLLDSKHQLFIHPCPHLAEDIETYASNPQKLKTIINQTIQSIPKRFTALVLGCTHYILVKKQITSASPGTLIIEPSLAIANQTQKILEDKNLLKAAKNQTVSRIFFTTGNAKSVSKKATSLLKQAIIFSPCSL